VGLINTQSGTKHCVFSPVIIKCRSRCRFEAAKHDTYVGPTTVSLVFDNFLIVASERPKCALTRSGGVKASHWFKETSWKTSISNKCGCKSAAGQDDP
jgi:hypothetical protein